MRSLSHLQRAGFIGRQPETGRRRPRGTNGGVAPGSGAWRRGGVTWKLRQNSGFCSSCRGNVEENKDHTSPTRLHVILNVRKNSPPPSAEPRGVRSPYQPHAKQTRARSGSLPGIRLREGSQGGGGKRKSTERSWEEKRESGGSGICSGDAAAARRADQSSAYE